MLNKLLKFNTNPWIDLGLKVAIATILLCLFSPYKLDIGQEVPLTLQTFFVLLPAVLFGWRVGFLSVGLYLIVGIIGLPVFADFKSGISHIQSAAGGFYIAFLMAATACGLLAELISKKNFGTALFLFLLGHLIILFMGFFWLDNFTPDDVEVFEQVQKYMPMALVKSAFGVLIVVMLKRPLEQKQQVIKSK